ncbi:MAG: pentapeptide repeat-containing protein [Anaerolineae bacterium]|nr:pentapeptide repeat-containing protein [Anaerolineae bacterium]
MSAIQELTGRLIEKIRSRDNAEALEAINALRSFDGLAVLRGETLIRANLQGADLAHVDLRETVLIWANLRGAILTGCDLRGAVLFRADLQSAVLTGCDLRQAYLLKTNLEGVRLEGVIWGSGTTLPDGGLWAESVDLRRFTDPRHPHFWRDDDPTSPAHQEVGSRARASLHNSRLIH